MELQVLGCATPYPRPGEPCSGYLLSNDSGDRILLDCGPGVFAALLQQVEPAALTAVWISHLHPDHSADLLPLASWALNTPDAPRLTIFGPPGWIGRLETMLTEPPGEPVVTKIFDAHDIVADTEIHVGRDMTLTPRRVQHSVTTFGVRITDGQATIAYSGDSGPCDTLVDLARDVNTFLCEAGAARPMPAHCTPLDAYRTAQLANARSLLLTHISPGLTMDQITSLPRTSELSIDVVTQGSRWQICAEQ